MELAAKHNFHKVTEAQQLAALAETLNSTPVLVAMIYTTAHLVEQGLSEEQLKGAKAFRTALLNIAVPDVAPKSLPVKSLADVPEKR